MKRLEKRSRGSGSAAALCRAVAFGLAALLGVATVAAAEEKTNVGDKAAQAQTSANSSVKEDDSRRVYVFLNEGSDNAAWKRWREEALALEKKKRKEGVLNRYNAEENEKIAEERKAFNEEWEKRAQETRRRDWRQTLEEDRRSASERAEARLAGDVAEELERDVLPRIEIDWEAVSLDGATIRDEEAVYFPIHIDFVGNDKEKEPPFYSSWRFGIPATLADVKRTKSWREKTLRNVGLGSALPGESFVGWTFENCRFGLQGKPFMSLRFNTCDFADASISGDFWPSGAITFEQFAATRTFKEGATSGKNANGEKSENAENVAKNPNVPRLQFQFAVDGWEFGALENVRTSSFSDGQGRLQISPGASESAWNDRVWPGDPILAELARKADPSSGLTTTPAVSFERFPTDAATGRIWRNSQYYKDKSLAGVAFCGWLNGGDFSGFDLTNAVVFAPNANLGFKLDGATIRGLRVVDGRGSEGAITKEALYSTKSWKQKNLRGVRFTSTFDLRGADFSGCDLTDAYFATSLEGAKFDGATINGCRFERWCWADAPEGDDLSQRPLTVELLEKSANGRGAQENLASLIGVEFPEEIQNRLDRRRFESREAFAKKDFSGATLRFRDMSGWDLRGFDLSGCEIITSSLEGADLTGATIDGATFTQLVGDKKINEYQSLNLSRMKVLLTGAQLASTTTYERDDWRGVSLIGKLDFTGFKFGNWKGARINQYGGFEGADFTDAEIYGVFHSTYPRPEYVEKTRTFKEGRLNYDEFFYSEREVAELQRRYALFKEKGAEALQAEDDAWEAALADKRIFYVYLRNSLNGAAAAGASSLSERSGSASQVDSASGLMFEKESDAEAKKTATAFEIERAGRERRYLKRKKDDGTFKKYCDEEKAKGASDRDAEAKATERLQRETAAEEEIVVRGRGWFNWELANLDGAIISDVNGLRFEGSEQLVFGVPAQFYFLYRTKNWTEKRWRGVRFLGGFKPSDFEGWTLENCEFGDSPKPSDVLIGP
ncbi:MAG: pentapeptide repeat-containing protein [Thermoguttaceae bacterium]|nr:pentapeptide repeat-containing protein [Thermoguttaceae bacterium]